MDTFFSISDIYFFHKRIKANQVYRKTELEDLSDAQRIKAGIYDKTNQWAAAVVRKYKKRFNYAPDNRWQMSGYLKKYSWACLYLEEFGNHDIYYTVGVDAEMLSLIIKIDFDRTNSKNLTKEQISIFDSYLSKKNIQWLIIPVEEIKDKTEDWLIQKTHSYIENTFDDYKELHRMLLKNGSIQPEPQQNLSNYPLNQILYGPPGTGKTYSTVARAYEIVKGIEVTDESYTTAKTWFKSELAKEEDRQLDFITFHQNYSYEDFVMGLKPDIEGDGLNFTPHRGVFYQICQRALKNWKDSQKTIEVIEQEKSFEQLFEEFKDDILDKIEKSEKGRFDISKSAYINRIEEDAFIYTGDNWNQNGRMKFDDVIKIYQNPKATDRKEAKKTANISRTAIEHISYYYKVAETLREFSNKQKKEHHFVEKVILKNYVLVIDEINRANISRVFGELITLIEDDKRWGNEHEMEVRLPDGKTKFTVPKNLHIIGTMNTADKSIALLDIALRRRFEFVGLFPNKEKVVIEYQDFFEALNNAIKAKKGVDFMIGHSYFMSKGNQAFDFKSAMNTKVIPLLNEYFYNPRSTDDVKKIINEALNKTSLADKYEVAEENYQLIITEKNAGN
ncbi:MAG: McrB family protein [Flavobacterium sp.]